jgi:hypothetical protein
MNWFRENRFLGTFLVVVSGCTLAALWFWLSARSAWDAAMIDFNQAAAELNRLERLAPYPSGANLRQMKAHADDYAAALTRLKDELRTRVVPPVPLAPNEFQSRLRLAMTAIADKSRAKKVRLPDKFYLGFDEFTSVLPSEAAAPLLGQELAQIEWLLDTLFEAGVDALTSFRRTPLPEEHGMAAPAVTPVNRKSGAVTLADPKLLERNVLEATFVSTPAAARKVLNQIAGTNQHFLIVRLWHVRNEKDKGPPREVSSDTAGLVVSASSPAPAGSPGAKPSPAALDFIVGNEHLEVTAKVEIVRFAF